MAKKLITLGKPKKKPSITLGRPIARSPKWENQIKFQHGFLDLHAKGYQLYGDDLDSINWWGHTVCSSRNAIVEECLKRKSDYLCFFDDDMTVMNLADDIEKMINHNKDIVAAMGVTKGAPHWCNIAKVIDVPDGLNDYNLGECRTWRIHDFPDDKLFEVDIIGTAFMLIKREVFENIRKPWFYMPPNFVTGGIKGEDTTFCIRAKMAGYKIWVDPTIQMGHIGDFGYGINYHSASFRTYKDKLISDAKNARSDVSCDYKLIPEVQEAFQDANV